MVETEKVCNHKVSSATTTSELVHRTKPGGNFVSTSETTTTFVETRESDRRPTITRSTSAYYVFSSLPQVVPGVRPRTGYRNNVSRPRGAHDYFNVMWDPHVYRGTTTTLTSSLKQPDNELISSREQDRQRRRRAFLAGTNNNNNNNSVSPVGNVGSNTTNRNRYRMTTKVTSRSRTFPPPEGRHQVHVQTEEYLEDLTRDVLASRGPEVDAIVQTDPIEDDELTSSALGRSNVGMLPESKSGVDASTQVLPGELFSFDERVQPIVEAVVGKILEQALLETMEEEEIGALKAQQNRFLEKRNEEERVLKRLKEQQERISAEKERLKRHLEFQLSRQHHQQQPSQNGNEELLLSPSSSSPLTNNNALAGNSSTNSDAGDGAANNAMSTSYLLELLPSVINSLRQEGFITEEIGDGFLSSFVPLWASSCSKPDNDKAVDPNNILDEDGDDFSNQYQDGCHSRVNSLDILASPSPVEKDLESKSPVIAEEEGEDVGNAAVGEEDEITNQEIQGEEAEGTVEEEEVAQVIEESGEEQPTPDCPDENTNVNNDAETTADGDPNVNPVDQETTTQSQLPNGAIPNLETRQE